MALEEQAPPRPRTGLPALARLGPRAPRVSGEMLGYVVLAVALAALLWSRIGDVDGFYLDEWIYVHGSQYIWENLPGSVVGEIPFWDRGAQRLYSTLLAPVWGALPTSTAYTLSHVLNVLLLVSAVVPTALLARSLIDVPALRVLAVALGTVIPWLMIGSHLLTENLAFPLYMWAVYAIVRCAEAPSVGRQVVALALIAALTLCRLNLGFIVVALFVAVLVAEAMRRHTERDAPLGAWLRGALRREAVLVIAAVAVAAAAIVLAIRGGAGVSGRYGGLDFGDSIDRLFGATAEATWRTVLTYLRGVVVGGFVFPVAMGVGVALAGIAGRLGRRFVVPSLVALLGLAVVLIVVSTSTVGGSLEERYVMYVYTPIAVLAVAGVPRIHSVGWWLLPGSALAAYALAEGVAAPASNAGHFFAAPGGAFWTRVVEHRVVSLEEDLVGWLAIDERGWLLVGAGLLVMTVFVFAATRLGRRGLIVPVLAGGLALCAVAQALALNYGFKQELYGTAEAPGGIALSDDPEAHRETWLDDRVPAERSVAVMPGVVSPAVPYGGTEVLQFWNRALDDTVALYWNGTVVPVPPGYGVAPTELGPDGLARWVTRPEWLAAYRDDPRVQFPGRLVTSSPISPYALYRTGASERALWTSTGVQPDGAVVRNAPASMTLNRSAANGTRTVVLTLQAAEGASRRVRWRVARGDAPVAAGRLRPGKTREVRLPVPPCRAGAECAPVTWTLRASGPAVDHPLPMFGAVGAPRAVILHVGSARIPSER